MCVIAFSPKGVKIPSEQQIKQMWQHNPDGAGYAYVDKKGSVVYKKGFMSLSELLAELEAPERFKNTNFALHFRIGTSGKNDKATCHPFPVSNCFGDLRKTEGKADSVLFHNGILSDGGISSPLASDTQDFVIAMYPLFKKYNQSKTRDFFIEELIDGSRLLVLYKNNAFKMFGKWDKDGDIWVSNTSYKHSYSWYGSGYYGWYEYGYDDDGEWGEIYPDGYYGGKTKSSSTKSDTIVFNNSPIEDEEAQRLWQEIIKKEYKYITDAQLDILKQSSEEYTHSTLKLAGYTLGYDMSQSLVWLEETPITLDEEQLELDVGKEE